MKKIKSVEDARRSGLEPAVAALAEKLVNDLIRIYRDESGGEWDPEMDGYVLVIEPDDDPDDPEFIEILGRPLYEAMLEGVTREEGCLVSCTLWDNDSGLTLLLMDHPDVDPRVRAHFEADLVEDGDSHVL